MVDNMEPQYQSFNEDEDLPPSKTKTQILNEQIHEGGEEISRNKYVIELARKAQLTVEAQVRVTLEGQVFCNPRYQTIFDGLKKNHPHNVALVHPMCFLLRRVIFAVIIIFLYNESFWATLTLMMLSLFILGYVICENQWEVTLVN